MYIRMSQLKDYLILLYKARCEKDVLSKYLYTATIMDIPKFHKTTLPRYMAFTKEYASFSDEQVEVMSIE